MFPALANLVEHEPDGVGVIYIAPIKALLNNQEDRLGTYAEMVGLRRFVWHGDVGDSAKRRFVKEPAEILMTTPESLEVMLVSSESPVARLFKDLRIDRDRRGPRPRRHGSRRAPHVRDRAARACEQERHPARGTLGHRRQPGRDPRVAEGLVEARGRGRRPAEESCEAGPLHRTPRQHRRASRGRLRRGRPGRRACSSVSHARSRRPSPSGCAARSIDVFVHHCRSRSRSGRPPRIASPTARTRASSAPPHWSSESTSAISISSFRPTRRARSPRSCSAWGGPDDGRAPRPTRPSCARTRRPCSRPSPSSSSHARAGSSMSRGRSAAGRCWCTSSSPSRCSTERSARTDAGSSCRRSPIFGRSLAPSSI